MSKKNKKLDLSMISDEVTKDIKLKSRPIKSFCDFSDFEEAYMDESAKKCRDCKHYNFEGSYDYEGRALIGGGNYVCTKGHRFDSPAPFGNQSKCCKKENGFEAK